MERDSYLDCTKGFLIVLVVLGHTIQYGSGIDYYNNGTYYNDWLMRFIYSFHMPLFMFISGYLAFFSHRKNGGRAVCLKRIKQLLLPIAVWTPVMVLCDCLINKKTISYKSIPYTFFTIFWFLWAILLSNVFVYILSVLKGRKKTVLISLFVLFVFLCPDVLWIHAYKFTIPFFLVGFFLAKSRNTYYIGNGNVRMVWIVAFIILFPFYKSDTFIYVSKMSIFGLFERELWIDQLLIDFYRFIIGFVGCQAVLVIIGLLYGLVKRVRVFSRCFEWLGRNSLPIYILSTICFSYLVPHITYMLHPSVLLWIVQTVVIICACVLITAVIKRNRTLSKLLIGG